MQKYAILAEYTSSLVADLEAERSPKKLDFVLGGHHEHLTKTRPGYKQPGKSRLEGSFFGAQRALDSSLEDRDHSCSDHQSLWGSSRQLGSSPQRHPRSQLGADVRTFPHSRHGGRGE